MSLSAEHVYKIAPAALWVEAESRGEFLGSEHDLRDGFIHFSTAAQAAETLRKHFAGQSDLVVIRVRVSDLGAALRWEPSRGGQLFPHLYGPLPTSAAIRVDAIGSDERGDARLPPLAD